MADRAEDAEQQAVHHHDVERAEAGGDARGVGDDRHRQVVGGDAGRGERLDRQDRVRPHLAALDRVEHLAAEDEALEAGRGRGQHRAGERAGGEDGDGGGGVAPGRAERLRERARVERRRCRRARGGGRRRPGCARGRGADSGRRRGAGCSDLRAPWRGRPRSGGTIAPARAGRWSRARRRCAPCTPRRALRAAPSALPASAPSARREPVTAPDQLSIETPEQVALEFPLAGVGSRFLALADRHAAAVRDRAWWSSPRSAGTWSLLGRRAAGPWFLAVARHRRVPAVLRLLRRLRGVLARADAGQAPDRPARAQRHRAAGPDRRGDPAQPAAHRRSTARHLRHRHRHDARVVAQPAARRSRGRHGRRAREGADARRC